MKQAKTAIHTEMTVEVTACRESIRLAYTCRLPKTIPVYKSEHRQLESPPQALAVQQGRAVVNALTDSR
jgi:hypothetical protein